jgi:hypothetical protein
VSELDWIRCELYNLGSYWIFVWIMNVVPFPHLLLSVRNKIGRQITVELCTYAYELIEYIYFLLLFLNYTIHRRHSLSTHTHTYEYTHKSYPYEHLRRLCR